MAWNDILADEEFQRQPYEVKESLANSYFKLRIAGPELSAHPTHIQDKVQNTFMATIGEKPIPFFRSTVNALVRTIGPEAANNIEAIMDPEKAMEDVKDIRKKFPATGKGEFLGTAAGSIATAGAALVASPFVPWITIPYLSYMGAQGIGSGRLRVAEHEKATGEDISAFADWSTSLGYGAAEVIFERLGFKSIRKAVDLAGPQAYKMLGKAIRTRDAGHIAKTLVSSIAPVTVKTGAIEGLEEAATQLSQNILTYIGYDREQAWTEGVGQAGALGFAGGVLLGPLGAAAFSVKGKGADINIRPADEAGLPEGVISDIEAENNVNADVDNPRSDEVVRHLQNLKELSEEASIENTLEANQARDQAYDDTVYAWRLANPRDADGRGMLEAMDEYGIEVPADLIPDPTIVAKTGKAVRLTTKQNEAGAVQFVTSTNDKVTVIKKGNVSKIEMERVLTAINFTAENSPGLINKARSITIAPGSNKAWFAAVFEIATGLPLNKNTEALVKPESIKALRDRFDEIAVYGYMDNNFNVLLRGTQGKSPLGSQTDRYIYSLGHELQHLSDEESGAAKTFVGMDNDAIDSELESRANKAAIEIRQTFVNNAPNAIKFQEKSQSPNDPIVRHRLLYGMQGVFSDVIQSEGQLYRENDDGTVTPVNAAVDTDTGVVYLSQDIDLSTIGHEAMEVLLDRTADSDPLMLKALELFGNKEALSDAVGEYYAGTITDPFTVRYLGNYLKDMWLGLRNFSGVDNTQDNVVRQLNSRIQSEAFVRAFDTAPQGQPVKVPRLGNFDRSDGTTIQWERKTASGGISAGIVYYSVTVRKTQDQSVLSNGIISEERLLDLMSNDPNGSVRFQERPPFEEPSKIRGGQTIFRQDFLNNIQAENFRQAKKAVLDAPPIKHLPNAIRTAYADKANVLKRLALYDDRVRKVLQERVFPLTEISEVEPLDFVTAQAESIMPNTGKMQAIFNRVLKGEGINNIEGAAAKMYAINRQIEEARALIADKPDATTRKAATERLMYWEEILKLNDLEAGRRLNSMKVVPRTGSIFELIKSARAGALSKAEMDLFKEALTNHDIQTINRLSEKYREASPSTKKDILWGIFYQGILSGPKTHFKNLFSNTAWLVYQIPHRGTLAAVDAVMSSDLAQALIPALKGRQRKHYFGEMTALWTNGYRGIKPAIALMKKTWRTGIAPENLMSKWELDLGSARWAFDHAKNPLIRKYADALNSPTKALIAADVFFKSIAADAELGAIVIREMRRTGATDPGQIVITDKMQMDALEFAQRATFVDEPGRLAGIAFKIRQLPGARLVVPFVNTVTNILKRGIELTPVLGAAKGIGDIRAGKSSPVEVIANQLEGALLLYLLMNLFDEDSFTGATPQSPAKRDAFYRQGKLPWSFRVGDKWIRYKDVEPFGLIFSNIATVRDAIIDVRNDEKDLTESFTHVANMLTKTIVETSFASSIFDVTERGWQNVVNRIPANFVPFSGMWRAINQFVEGEQYDGRFVRDNNSITAQLSNSLPWFIGEELRITPPTRINAMGDEIVIPGGGLRQWLPVQWRGETKDALELELEELQIYPGLPSRNMKIDGEDITLPMEFYREYALLYGKETKEALTAIIASEGYKQAPDEAKTKTLERAVRVVHDRVRNKARGMYKSLFNE